MSARARRKERRFKGLVQAGRVAGADRARADEAEIRAALFQDRLGEVGFKLAAVTKERDEARREAADLEHYAADRAAELRDARERLVAQGDELAKALKEIARIRQEDHDASKLRRRLREAKDEIAQLHERVRRAEAGGAVEKLYGRASTPGGPPRFGDGGGI